MNVTSKNKAWVSHEKNKLHSEVLALFTDSFTYSTEKQNLLTNAVDTVFSVKMQLSIRTHMTLIASVEEIIEKNLFHFNTPELDNVCFEKDGRHTILENHMIIDVVKNDLMATLWKYERGGKGLSKHRQRSYLTYDPSLIVVCPALFDSHVLLSEMETTYPGYRSNIAAINALMDDTAKKVETFRSWLDRQAVMEVAPMTLPEVIFR